MGKMDADTGGPGVTDLVLIGGGQDEGYYVEGLQDEGLQVHAFDFVENAWYRLAPRGKLPMNRERAACTTVGDVVVLAVQLAQLDHRLVGGVAECLGIEPGLT